MDTNQFKGKKVLILGPAEILTKQLAEISLTNYDFIIRLNRSIETPITYRGNTVYSFDVLFHNLNEVGSRNGGVLSQKNIERTGIKLVIYGFGFWSQYPRVFKYKRQLEKFGVDLLVVPKFYYNNYRSELGGWYPTTGFIAISFFLEMDLKELCIAGFSFFQTPYIGEYNDKIENAFDAMSWATELNDHNPLIERVVIRDKIKTRQESCSIKYFEH